MRQKILSLLVGAWLVCPLGVSAQTSSLLLDSQAGDYIGGGIVQIFTLAEGTFTADRNFDNGVSVSFTGFGFSHWWNLDFAAAGEVPLVPGAYEQAVRFPFQAPGQNGLSVSGDGRGCNTLTGRFDVLEVTYGADGGVVSFAADFEQHCEGAGPALFGSIRFNSGPVLTKCSSTVNTFDGLNGAVEMLMASGAAKTLLNDLVNAAQAAADASKPKRARTRLVSFIGKVVALSHRSSSDILYVVPSQADRLVCGAANVMTNVAVP